MMSADKMAKYLNGCEVKETVQKCLELLKLIPEDSEVMLSENIMEVLIDAVSDAEVGLIEFLRKGGLNVCLAYIKGPYVGLRLKACRLIAEITQNNYPAQDAAYSAGLLPSLIKQIDTDTEMKHAMSAISSIVRGHPEAMKFFVQNGGPEFLRRGLRAESVDIVIKFAFFVGNAFTDCRSLKGDIRAVGVVAILLKRIDKAVEINEEYLVETLLGALIDIVDDDNQAIEECQLPENRLRENLRICKETYPPSPCSDLARFVQILTDKLFNGTVQDAE
ncbi:uncharacterized protein LOC111052099 [Nilaparvata lugens]|uniref:uncharacterized protein LOC111052099 n=1 Tax=Nilaparvata lugens TaxID=108931 RepID=UPI000B98DFD4|nr:uncharacterized protein LOC111052099 [Nilaparvata lugens]